MTKYILIWGRISKAPDGGKSFCEELIKWIKNKPIKILDCMFASPENSWAEKHKRNNTFFSKYINDFKSELANPLKFIEQIKDSDIVFLNWWIPRQLISLIGNLSDFKSSLNEKIIAGSSGGADAICKYYGVGKTSNIGEGIRLLPIKFIPHWKSDYDLWLDVDWDGLKNKLKYYKEDLPIITLKEWEFKVF